MMRGDMIGGGRKGTLDTVDRLEEGRGRMEIENKRREKKRPTYKLL